MGTKLNKTMNSDTVYQTVSLQFFCTVSIAGYWRRHIQGGPKSKPLSGGARGHPDRGSSFPDRGAEVNAGSTLPCKLPPPYFVALHIL